MYDGTFHSGRRVLTFNPVLQGKLFPLGEIIDKLLNRFQQGFQSPVDLEYAVELDTHGGLTHASFYLLQARPLVARNVLDEVEIPELSDEQTILRTNHTMGNGRLENIQYLVWVKATSLDPIKSRRLAEATAKFDQLLRERGEQYILVGPGRWGSSNLRLGIPVTFAQISNAAVIAETSAKGHDFEPSQGTHFFHLITAGGIVYMAVIPEEGDLINLDALQSMKTEKQEDEVLLLKSKFPMEVVVDGRNGNGIVFQKDSEPKSDEFQPDWEAGDFD